MLSHALRQVFTPPVIGVIVLSVKRKSSTFNYGFALLIATETISFSLKVTFSFYWAPMRVAKCVLICGKMIYVSVGS